jgi:xanthine dehydrogenase accessory factor
MIDIYEEIYKMKKRGQDGVLVTVVDKEGQGPASVGKKLLVCSNGEKKGTVGGGELEFLAAEKARELLREKRNIILSYDFSGKKSTEDNTVNINMICGGLVTLYYEYIGVNPKIFILGVGNVGGCLANFLNYLDYSTVLVDDREDIPIEPYQNHEIIIGNYDEVIPKLDMPDGCFVVVAGYSHEIEYGILKEVFKKDFRPAYIGLLASKNKASAIIGKISAELDREPDLSEFHAPIGLDIGGDSPEEIAISIISEIQAIRYGHLGNKHLSEQWMLIR